jgi:glycine betaine/proline transport system permease protein
MLIAAVLAYQSGGGRLALMSTLGLGFIAATGLWQQAMESVALCGAAVLFSFIIGSVIGVSAALNDWISAVVRPISDTLQTMPQFVFLIPAIMFFHVGDFPALLAIMMYSIVPAIRYTEHGIRGVGPQTIEVATAQGCTRAQIFWQVQLPLAFPEIALGLNQTIMFALSMLVVAALVGTNELGQQIYISLSTVNAGAGLTAGFAITILAMITDRVLSSYSRRGRPIVGRQAHQDPV